MANHHGFLKIQTKYLKKVENSSLEHDLVTLPTLHGNRWPTGYLEQDKKIRKGTQEWLGQYIYEKKPRPYQL